MRRVGRALFLIVDASTTTTTTTTTTTWSTTSARRRDAARGEHRSSSTAGGGTESNQLAGKTTGTAVPFAAVPACPRSASLKPTAGTWEINDGRKDGECPAEIGRRSCEIESNERRRTSGRSAMPEARGFPLLGTLPALLAAGGPTKLHEYVDRRHRELGPVFRDRIGPVTGVFVNSPHEFRRIFRLEGSQPKHFLPEAWLLYNEVKACRRGLFFMDGDEWLHFRRILNKLLLLSDPTETMSGPCQEAAEALSKKWETFEKVGATVSDLEVQLYQWSSEAMLATLMGSSWRQERRHICRESLNLAYNLRQIFECSSRLSVMPAKLAMSLKLPAWRKFVESVDTALATVRALVPEIVELGADDGLLKAMMREGILGDDLVRIIGDFILAAGDTTTFSTQWSLYLLATHPEIQEKLFQSVRHVPTLEVRRHPLLKGIIKETLRLYPTAPFISRYLPENCVVGDYHVQKGEMVLLSIYTSGRDEANFPRPNDFHPERWIRTEEGNYRGVIHPHASLPFAMGARSCIGRKLAETQMALALTQLVKTFWIECTNKNNVTMNLRMISIPSEPIHLKLRRRDC